MNFKSILKTVSLGLLISQVQSAPITSECEELISYYDGTSTTITECEENASGQIVNLNIRSPDFKKIATYSSLVNLDIFVLSDNLDMEVFENLTNLESLSLACKVSRYGSSMYKILNKSFNGLKQIKKLSLDGFDITEDTMEGISSLTNLEELVFDSCYSINNANFDPILNLKDNLKAFTINSHPYQSGYVKAIPEQVYSLTNLKNLTISYNQVSSISEDIIQLKNLESLDLSSNTLGEIPDVLNELPNLKYVTFANNPNLMAKALTNESLVSCNYSSTLVCKTKDLSCLTGDLELCTEGVNYGCLNVKKLFAEKNIDITINNCSENENGDIITLYVEGNNNEAVIEVISGLESLEELTISEKNEDLKLEALKNLNNLSTLTVISPTSKITSPRYRILKDSLKSLKIKTLNLKGVYIDQDFVDDLSLLSGLETLTFNTCDYVDDVDFSPLKSLTSITDFQYIYHIYTGKRLTEIPDFVFSLKNLKSLSITKNEITSVPTKITHLRKLEYLDLSGNKIKEVPDDLNKLKNLKSINLSNNGISGEALNNETLETCIYKSNNVCKTKELSCLQEGETIPFCEDDCGKIKTMILAQGLTFLTKSCTMNENNEVTYLRVNLDSYGEDNVKQMLAYPTITSFEVINGSQTTINNIANNAAIETLIFDYVDNGKLDLKPLRNLKNLTNLEVSTDKYSFFSIKKNSLKYLTGLKRLAIEYVDITQDNLDELKKLTALEELSFLNCNFYEGISFSSLKSLVNLTSLSIENPSKSTESLTSVPRQIYSLTNLKNLSLKGHKFTSISSNISSLTQLEELGLNGNDLRTIPSALEKLPNLKKVDFLNNPNLSGKTLTNPSLEKCLYNTTSTTICIAKEMSCFVSYTELELC